MTRRTATRVLSVVRSRLSAMRDDEQPVAHEIGNRTYLVADVEPLDLDGVRTMQVGVVAWAAALVVLLALRGRLVAHDAEWWIWVCVAGLGLGLVGWDHCARKRRRRIAEEQAAASESEASG